MVVPSDIGPSVWAGTIVSLMQPGVNTRASVDQAAGRRRPAPVSRSRPSLLLAGKPDAGPARQQWCRARHRGVTVNTGTRETGARPPQADPPAVRPLRE